MIAIQFVGVLCFLVGQTVCRKLKSCVVFALLQLQAPVLYSSGYHIVEGHEQTTREGSRRRPGHLHHHHDVSDQLNSELPLIDQFAQ